MARAVKNKMCEQCCVQCIQGRVAPIQSDVEATRSKEEKESPNNVSWMRRWPQSNCQSLASRTKRVLAQLPNHLGECKLENAGIALTLSKNETELFPNAQRDHF